MKKRPAEQENSLLGPLKNEIIDVNRLLCLLGVTGQAQRTSRIGPAKQRCFTGCVVHIVAGRALNLTTGTAIQQTIDRRIGGLDLTIG